MDISKLKKNIVLKNGTILDPYNNTEKKGDVHIENGEVKYVDPKQAEIERIKNIPETLEGN